MRARSGPRGVAATLMLALAVALVASAPLAAQAPAGGPWLVRGRVLAAGVESPIGDALVRALASRTAARTERAGRFALWVAQLPETLTVAAIGHRPDTLVLAAAPAGELVVRLAARPIPLAEVIATAPAGSDRELSSIGRWQLPLEAVRSVPPAVEADVFRSLSMVPAVSFSTPLSARPLVRGYDAGESSIRIDGFEMLNLYHIGRAFSAFPADATEQVSVTTAPHAAELGGTMSGVVDITGRSGTRRGLSGGANLSLGALSAWLGGGDRVRWFSAARAIHFSVFEAATNKRVPYGFQDLYASGVIEGARGPALRLTLFGSRDRLADRDEGLGMDWSNLLVGARWFVDLGPAWLGEVWATGNRFGEDVTNVPARRSDLDVRNRFGRVAAGSDLTWNGASSRMRMGASAGLRSIGNEIVARPSGEFPAVDTAFRRAELAAYVDWSRRLGGVALQLGARLDAAGSTSIFQPRARLRAPLAPGLDLGLAAGRTGRFFHLVSDPRAEPELAFYDFWLDAAAGEFPKAVSDHVALELDWRRGRLTGRGSIFASRASGLVELRPEEDQRAGVGSPFRIGDGRSYGLELQLGLEAGGERRRSLSATYVLGRSERRWADGWVPWMQDRRHLFRVLGNAELSARWTVFGTVELTSGAPLTPVEHVIFTSAPDPASPGHVGDLGRPAYVFGPENSARMGGTARADVGVAYAFQGPGRSRMTVGLSVINLGFGPVAPLVPEDPFRLVSGVNGEPPLERVTYKRLFDLPAIPTITARIEF